MMMHNKPDKTRCKKVCLQIESGTITKYFLTLMNQVYTRVEKIISKKIFTKFQKIIFRICQNKFNICLILKLLHYELKYSKGSQTVFWFKSYRSRKFLPLSIFCGNLVRELLIPLIRKKTIKRPTLLFFLEGST
jgi:hypothetical protein